MLANFAIGLREGLEAALVVGILVAYLKKQNRQDDVRRVAIGVFAAIFVSLVVGLSLTFLTADAEDGASKFIAGVASLVAVVFVTWMIFWMAKHARSLPSEMHNKLEKTTSGLAVAGIAFFAVVREGVETSVFLWSATNAAEQGWVSILGAVFGLITATIIGYGIYRGSLKLNLRTFFAVTSGFLIVVAAGIFAYGIHEFEELGWFPFLQDITYDVSGIIPKDSAIDIFLRGTISFRSAPTQLQTLVWLLYLIPVSVIFYLRTRRK
jgi:high-affinity iron transporter